MFKRNILIFVVVLISSIIVVDARKKLAAANARATKPELTKSDTYVMYSYNEHYWKLLMTSPML
jgi:hypothetical protein